MGRRRATLLTIEITRFSCLYWKSMCGNWKEKVYTWYTKYSFWIGPLGPLVQYFVEFFLKLYFKLWPVPVHMLVKSRYKFDQNVAFNVRNLVLIFSIKEKVRGNSKNLLQSSFDNKK